MLLDHLLILASHLLREDTAIIGEITERVGQVGRPLAGEDVIVTILWQCLATLGMTVFAVLFMQAGTLVDQRLVVGLLDGL